MAKNKVEQPKRELTRREITRWRKEKKRQRIIFGIGAAIIVVVVGLVGAGWYMNDYRPMHEKVIQVNDVSFEMGYYVQLLEYYNRLYPNQMASLAGLILSNLEQSELIRQEAEKLGYTVSEEEIDTALAERELERTPVQVDLLRTELLIDKLQAEHFASQLPATIDQAQALVMLLESESQAKDVKARLEAGEDFGTLAAELSLDSSKDAKGDLGLHPRDVYTALFNANSELVDYVFSAEAGTLSDPLRDDSVNKGVGYWLVKVVDRKTENDVQQAQLFAMLLSSEDEALAAKARLDAGEDFGAVSRELSQLSETEKETGDIGWMTADEMSEALKSHIFNENTRLGEVSPPIRDEDAGSTTGGYWLIKVTAKEADGELSAVDKDYLIALAFNDWVEAINSDTANVINHDKLTTEKQLWAITRASR